MAILITVIIVFVLIFPIFINLYLLLDINMKKAYFSIYLYDVIKVLGGYAQVIKSGFAFHLSEKKAIILPFRSFFGIKQNYNLTNNFKIISFSNCLEIGNNNDLFVTLYLGYTLNIVAEKLFKIIRYNRNGLKLHNDINIYTENDLLKTSCKSIVVFNLLSIISLLIKLILRKITNGTKNK